jgi:hypothetical protein
VAGLGMLAPTIAGGLPRLCTTPAPALRRSAVGARTRRPPPEPITDTPPTKASAGRKKEKKQRNKDGSASLMVSVADGQASLRSVSLMVGVAEVGVADGRCR